nr:cation-translocating P-type ATPase [uncultured Acetobacterium sp.]
MAENKTTGLTTTEARKRQEQYGKNELTAEKKENFFIKTFHIICEPMFLLLIVAAVIYFVLGEPRDGAVMLVFVIGIISIDVIQEWKTDQTLNALKELSAPHVTAIRDGQEITIASMDLVPGDLMLIAEGVKIPADGEIIKANDLCVDESSLTGEAEGVWKVTVENAEVSDDYWRRDYCYAGTLVTQGNATILVDKIGALTEYGKIGTNVASVIESPTPLQKQTGSLVKLCAGIAAVLFALVSTITYFNIPDHPLNERIIESILSGITLAMAMIPEEFPVILTVFLSMGAWRLAKKNSLVRKLPAVETLGAVSVLCVDKTGTITMNQMTVRETWAWQGDTENLCEMMGLGCETEAYDPMEKAMLRYCEEQGIKKSHLFGGQLITEYAFTNELKMMGHVWHHDGEIIIAAKGSPERLLTICNLTSDEKAAIDTKIMAMSKQGLRVIAVGEMRPKTETEIPKTITQARLTFLGLVGLADPPRESVKEDIKNCTKAGVRVVMITGDNGITASSIAKQIGMPNSDHIITGDELNNMSDEVLREKVKDVSIFSRVVPEHKMRIVKAFKDNGEVVAMTGDGVNDAPALKSADIGIAMGKRGSEVSREAADLILMDDNFSTIVDTIKDGRRIYDNIRKAVGYVFTIHIPIAASSLLAPLLGIAPASLFLLPLHVVLLELIIDPTCSIVLERQPAEHDIMERKPRNPDENIVTAKMLTKSVIQGLIIFGASFGTYFIFLGQGNAALARTMGLVVIMLSNLVLVQVNSSDKDFAIQSLKRLIKDKVMWAINIGTVLGILIILYTPLCNFLKLYPLTAEQFLLAVAIAFLSVFWYEGAKLLKWLRRKK